MQKKIFFLVIILLIIGTIAMVFIRSGGNSIPSGKYDAFAQCLASKNLTMYGTAWCSYCKKEKAAFGDSFKYVPYVDCGENPDLCMAKEIKGYPTWIDEKGQRYEGLQGLEKLSEISSCELPTN